MYALDPIERTASRLIRAEPEMMTQAFRDLLSDGIGGVQGRLRLLIDHADFPPTHPRPIGLAKCQEVPAGKADRPAAHSAGSEVTQNGIADRRLAGTGFSDEPQDLARSKRQGQVPHGTDGTSAIANTDIVERQERLRHGTCGRAATPRIAPANCRRED